ncbi:MAG: NUDIX domain-containing protein, partial [Chloroflexia bacterium]
MSNNTTPEGYMNEAALQGDILKEKRIRATALGIFRRGDEIFVAKGYDPNKDQYFYRPLGGGIEFGERGEEAIIREMREETGLELTNVLYLGICENIFTYLGEPGHEIVLLYEANFADPS